MCASAFWKPMSAIMNLLIELFSLSNKRREIWPLRCSVPSQADSGIPTQRIPVAFRMRKLKNKRSYGCQSFLQNIVQINHRATLETRVNLRSFHAREFLKGFQ